MAFHQQYVTVKFFSEWILLDQNRNVDKIETTISIKYFSELFFKKVCTYAASSAWNISTTFQPGRSFAMRWREITGANLRSVGFFHRETFPFLSSYSMGIDLNVTKCTNFKTEQCDSKMTTPKLGTVLQRPVLWGKMRLTYLRLLHKVKRQTNNFEGENLGGLQLDHFNNC